MSKRIRILFCTILFLILIISTHTHAGTPARIISLKPNITELIFALGAGDQVVGVTTWCNRPAAAKGLPKVADYIKPNVEKILALKPDLIVASEENSVKAPFHVLEGVGIPLVLLPFKDVNDLISSIWKLAEVTGHSKEGKDITYRICKNIEGLNNPSCHRMGLGGQRSNPSNKPQGLTHRSDQQSQKPRVLIVVGRRPLVATSKNTFLGELLELAGGENIVASETLYPHISMEMVIAKDPGVIIDFSMGSESRSREWGKYDIEAVKNKRIYALDISEFRAGPNIVEQINNLKKIIHR